MTRTDASAVSIGLFGPLTVRSGQDAVVLRGDIPRAIVARLALSAGEPVSADELIAELWPDDQATALTNLRSRISRLRSEGFPAAIHGDRQGYLLDVPAEAVDVLRFRALLGRAAEHGLGADEALEALAAAEALAAHEPLRGLEGFAFVRALRDRVLEERRGAVETLAELLLERGEHAVAVAPLAALVSRHPFDEKPTRLLATALARSGRSSEALEAIDGLGERLAEAQGLDLPARMAELRLAVVRRDPAVVSAGLSAAAVERSGIPIPLTRFIGRARERAVVAEARGASRLVTIVGAAGVGKTRLAIEVARQSTAAVDDEQVMVELTAAASPEAVVTVVADAVGATEHDVAAIATRLGGRRVLLVLDNAEHVLGAVASLAVALTALCPQLQVLTTSRESMRIPGERVVRLEPLVGEAEPDAVELFLERAADAAGFLGGFDDDDLFGEPVAAAPVGAGFGAEPGAGDDRAAGAIGRICRALDGIPLALELAASRLDVLSLGELEDSLFERALELAGPGDADGRHASLTSSIRWSYQLLDASQQELLQQLGRFAGSFTLDAVRGVCGEAAAEATLDLVQKSLVTPTDGEGGARRYRLLESVRAFLREEPGGADVPEEWWRGHSLWFAGLAERLGPLLRTTDARSARLEIEAAWPDLQLALATANRTLDRSTALRICGALSHYWFLKGMLVDGRAALERALALPGDHDPVEDAPAYIGVTLLAYQLGDAPAAFEYIRLAYEAAETAGDRAVQALALAQTAYGRSLFGEAELAEQLMGAASAAAVETEPWVRSEVAMCQGQMLRALGRADEALAALGLSHRLASEAGHEWIRSSAAYVAGKVLVETKRPREAVTVLRGGAAASFAADDATSGLALLHTLAGACALVERHEEGAQLLGAVDQLGERYSYNPVTAEGEDAQVHRDLVAVGLTPEEFARAVAAGRRLTVRETLRLTSALPSAPFEL
ncbi:BTAD domain-containing putative transcriptional regulator [Herbiconiux sp. KACC 21604]|uniref:BTAD domain-containing putative transcriptional regulator n=1 Tax=unclassified Herbiconiux TaxID=2618217 RepID=UPI0014932203|nr:BTAD domain-containing putative transcriptional regulator [Herbiconiux sp. SALV-R1]QJU53171.1 AAA family ATPase [Herbiconiux sp. SALV-R1]WPO88118.1 BTAD domain-containing putative transcriptional regulator [Herbiconiux sp. KACC 21604]